MRAENLADKTRKCECHGKIFDEFMINMVNNATRFAVYVSWWSQFVEGGWVCTAVTRGKICLGW